MKRLPEVLAAALAVVAASRIAGAAFGSGFPQDDAWIHLVYGRAIASGDGLAYNAGIAGAGATSPVWAAVAGVVHMIIGLDAPPVFAAIGLKVAGIVAHAAASATAARLGRLLGGELVTAIAAGALVATCPLLAFAAVSGMEVALASLLLLAAFVAAARERAALAGALAGVATCTRPEAAVAIVVVLPLALRAGGGVRRVAIACASAAALPAAWALRNLALTGRLLPATVYAKSASGLASTYGAQAGAGRALEIVVVEMLPLVRPLGAVALALDVVAIAIAARAWARSDRTAAALVPGAAALAGVLYVVGLALHTRVSHPGSFYFQRYILPAAPLLLVAALGAAARLVALRDRARVMALGVAVLGVTTWEIAGWREQRAFYADAVRQIDGVQVAIGRFIAESFPPDAVVWTADAGAIRYVGRRRTLDLGKLNTPELLRTPDVDPAWSPDVLAITAAAGFRATVGGQRPPTLVEAGYAGGAPVQVVHLCPPGAGPLEVRLGGNLVARGTCRANHLSRGL